MTPQEIALTRGDIQMARKEYGQAVAEYRIALQGNPKDALLLNKMGIAYQQLGDVNDAERSYKKAIKADKKFSSAINNLGTLEYQRKRYGRVHQVLQGVAHSRSRELPRFTAISATPITATSNIPKRWPLLERLSRLIPRFSPRREASAQSCSSAPLPIRACSIFSSRSFTRKSGDAEHAAHYLKLSRDYGYKEFRSAEKDPEFASVINDPRVQEVLQVPPSYLDPAKSRLPTDYREGRHTQPRIWSREIPVATNQLRDIASLSFRPRYLL